MDGATKEMSLNFLVVGLGSAGQRHIRAIRNLFPDAKVYVKSHFSNPKLISTNLEKYVIGADPIKHYNLRRVTDFNNLTIDQFDLSIIASLPNLRVSNYLYVEPFSKRILVEKPIATTLSDSVKLQKHFALNSKPIRVGYQNEFSTFQKKVREYIRNTKIDSYLDICFHENINSMNPFRDMSGHHLTKPEGGGVILGLSHELMFILTIFDTFEVDLNKSSLFTSNYFKNVYDHTRMNGVGKIGTTTFQISLSLSYSPDVKKKIRRGVLRNGSTVLSWDYPSGEITFNNVDHSSQVFSFPLDKDRLFEFQILDLLRSKTRTTSQSINLLHSHSIVKIHEQLRVQSAESSSISD